MNGRTPAPRHLAGGALCAIAAATVSACASGGGLSYGQEMDDLRRGCDARDGILTPIPGANTGRPATDYACTIRGPATRPSP